MEITHSRFGIRRALAVAGSITLGLASMAPAQQPFSDGADMRVPSDAEVWQSPDGLIHAGGKTYPDWAAYFASDFFRDRGHRCGTPDIGEVGPDEGGVAGTAADCSLSFTNPAAEYGPSNGVFIIDVVIHNIAANNGTGYIEDATLASQIDVLNEDFNALAGSLGAPGTDCAIEFRLAGITHSFKNTWYNDRGGYKSSLAWDNSRYLNIYTNTAGGNLGYVEGFPQQGIAGTASDGVVCNWQAFGRNSPLSPYDLGRTATHEVGHYLGLLHTFQGGCGTSDCARSGDLVCDTNAESSPNYSGCSRSSCGSPDPVKNYMDYSEDACMTNFTPDQAARMRCTLIHFRESLWIENSGGGGGGGGGGDPVDASIEGGVVTFGGLSTGDIGSLQASDNNRVEISSASSGNNSVTELEVTLAAAVASVSDLSVTVETAATSNRAKTAVELYDFASGQWVRLGRYNENGADQTQTFSGIANPGSFVEAGTGAIVVRINTSRRGGGFTTGIDLVQVVVTP